MVRSELLTFLELKTDDFSVADSSSVPTYLLTRIQVDFDDSSWLADGNQLFNFLFVIIVKSYIAYLLVVMQIGRQTDSNQFDDFVVGNYHFIFLFRFLTIKLLSCHSGRKMLLAISDVAKLQTLDPVKVGFVHHGVEFPLKSIPRRHIHPLPPAYLCQLHRPPNIYRIHFNPQPSRSTSY